MNARASFPVPSTKRYRSGRCTLDSIRPCSPRPMRRDCHGRLLSALIELGGWGCDVVDSHIAGWASATFIGARHGITLVIEGAEDENDAATRAEALKRALPESEFTIAGHIVADLSIDTCEVQANKAILTLSILTIEAW